MKNVIIAKSILHAVETGGSLFGRGGIKLHAAETSGEVLDLHRRIKADLIIIEFSQPDMNGAQLCTAIRSEPGLKDVSIIIVCEDSRPVQAACRDAGANAVVTRPVNPFDLFAKVAELIIIPQRKDMRVLLRVVVESSDRESPFFATSHNISVSGMLLETRNDLKEGDMLKCSFNIAHSEINAECTVIRADRTGSGRFRYGVKFVNLTARSFVIIEQYVRNRIGQ
ncbi:MAG: response regulator [Nitrospirae bacterium]|nr:response regulator [Nitrospirota bacterium]NTW66962.1 response regulator [Nitrospirota bacterium]